MSECLRLILKDLSEKYEIEKNKINLKAINNTVNEEMMKKENVDEFICMDDIINQVNEQINILLKDPDKFNSEKSFKLIYTLFEKIREFDLENMNDINGLSFNNFKRIGNPYNYMLLSSDNRYNALNGNYTNINKNKFTIGNNKNIRNSNSNKKY